MKTKINKLVLFFSCVLIASVSLKAQNKSLWSVNLGVNIIDVREHTTNFSKNLEDYFGTEEWNTNFLPSITAEATRYINDSFSVSLGLSANKIKTYMVLEDAQSLYFSIDASLNYKINSLVDLGNFDPYIKLGTSYQNIDYSNGVFDGKNDIMLTGGFGLNYWFNDTLGINFNTNYKHNFVSSGFDVFQHVIGVALRFDNQDY